MFKALFGSASIFVIAVFAMVASSAIADPPLNKCVGLQAAIDAASDGDVIKVKGDCVGTNYVIATNGLTLRGIANATLTNVVFSGNIHRAVEEFKEGKSLFNILSKVEYFPTLALQMINVGEETGELEAMLVRVAEVYERETSNAMQRFLSLLEPVMIIFLGFMIGGIIVSILMAIISVNDLPL